MGRAGTYPLFQSPIVDLSVPERCGLLLVNAAGDSATYSWKDATPPKRPGKPAVPCIQLINTKSRYKPFSILRPEDQPDFDVYAGEIRRDVTMYPWWNHWPAAMPWRPIAPAIPR